MHTFWWRPSFHLEDTFQPLSLLQSFLLNAAISRLFAGTHFRKFLWCGKFLCCDRCHMAPVGLDPALWWVVTKNLRLSSLINTMRVIVLIVPKGSQKGKDYVCSLKQWSVKLTRLEVLEFSEHDIEMMESWTYTLQIPSIRICDEKEKERSLTITRLFARKNCNGKIVLNWWALGFLHSSEKSISM